MPISPDSIEAFGALGLGFAFAGLLASGFELAARRPVSVRLLQAGGIAALASVPVLVFSAPVVILRGAILGRTAERRTVGSVMAATVLAGLWSLLCGRLVLDAAQAIAGG